MSDSKPRPTIRDLAKASGFSRSTISAALNNRANISEATREKIHQLAEEMGYRKDAKIDQLMGYLSLQKSSKDLLPMAWLYANDDEDEWTRHFWRSPLFDGAKAHAEKNGYRLEPFWLRSEGMTVSRMRTILRTRGIGGIILAPPFDCPEYSEFDFDGFACAELQNDPQHLGFNVACPDFTYNFDLAWKKVSELGYRRPGFCSIETVSRYQNEIRESRYFWHQQKLAKKNRISVFSYDQNKAWRDEFLKWIESECPDVLLINSGSIPSVLKRAGYRIPDDLGLISLNEHAEKSAFACSGVDQNSLAQGAAAVDIVIGHLSRGEQGAPALPRSIQVKGSWVDKGTVRSE